MTEISERLSAALAERYRIERRLGEGGMATVYLAEDLKHDRKVALKVLRPELAALLGAEPRWSPNGRELFYRSGRDELMATKVDASATFHANQPEALFSVSAYLDGGAHAAYAVSRDGRFLFGEQRGDRDAGRLILARHWFTELRPLLEGT